MIRYTIFINATSHVCAGTDKGKLMGNGTNDPAFFLDTYIKTYQLACKKELSLQIGLKHGHYTEGVGYETREL